LFAILSLHTPKYLNIDGNELFTLPSESDTLNSLNIFRNYSGVRSQEPESRIEAQYWFFSREAFAILYMALSDFLFFLKLPPVS
jgi:hypothetical protein